ncbi:hypothetical protein AB4254_10915 [Vibrio breoganii]
MKKIHNNQNQSLLVQLSNEDGVLDMPYIVRTGGDVSGHRHVSMDFYKEVIESKFNIPAINSKIEGIFSTADPISISKCRADSYGINLFANESGLLVHFNFDADYIYQDLSGTEEEFKALSDRYSTLFSQIAAKSGGFAQLHYDETEHNCNHNVYIPYRYFEHINTFDELTKFLSSQTWETNT